MDEEAAFGIWLYQHNVVNHKMPPNTISEQLVARTLLGAPGLTTSSKDATSSRNLFNTQPMCKQSDRIHHVQQREAYNAPRAERVWANFGWRGLPVDDGQFDSEGFLPRLQSGSVSIFIGPRLEAIALRLDHYNYVAILFIEVRFLMKFHSEDSDTFADKADPMQRLATWHP